MKWNIQPYMGRNWAEDIPRTHVKAREVWQPLPIPALQSLGQPGYLDKLKIGQLRF